MSDVKDKDPKSSGAGPTGTRERRSGRVTFDERGNSVWEWQLDTGVYSKDVSTQRLKKLDLDELSIAETAIQKKPEGLGGPMDKKPATGFNPYDNATNVGGGRSPYEPARALGDKFRDAPLQAEPVKRRTLDDMRKLSEAIKKSKKD